MRRALLWFGLAATALLTWLALRGIDFGEVVDAIGESEAEWLVPAFGALAASILVRAVRWRQLFVPGTRPPLGAVTAALLVGYLFNNLLPLRAGEAARLVDLSRRDRRSSRAQIAATIAVERFYDVAVLLILLFAALPWLPEVSWISAAAWLAALLAAALVVVVTALVVADERALRVLLWPLRRLPAISQERWEHAPANLARGLAALRRPGLAFGVLFWTSLSWVLLGISAWTLMLGFDFGLSPAAGLFVVMATGLAMIIPSPPAALGVFEAAAVVALDAYGVSRAHALSYALVLHALNSVPFIVAGLAVLPTGFRTVGKVRR